MINLLTKIQKNKRKLLLIYKFLWFHKQLYFSVNSLCFNPDGSQLLAAVGLRILVYNTAEGTLQSALSGTRLFPHYVGSYL